MQLYRRVKIGPADGDLLENMQTGRVGFVAVGAVPRGEGCAQTVPVYLSGICTYGIEPERLEDVGVNGPAEPRRCRVCGCTDDDCSGCIERTGNPCYWVEPDLCSACVDGEHDG